MLQLLKAPPIPIFSYKSGCKTLNYPFAILCPFIVQYILLNPHTYLPVHTTHLRVRINCNSITRVIDYGTDVVI